jgi:hypothetical protein
MKDIFILVVSLYLSQGIMAQSEQKMGVFQADSTWFKEIIKFPISFAQEIPFQGYEDLRFHPDWSKKEADGFWMYTFAWHVEEIQTLTLEDLTSYIEFYYDGLVDGGTSDIPKSEISFQKEKSDFRGTLTFFDRFHTKKMITLYVLVKTFYCYEKETSTIVFKISSKPPDHPVWNDFNQIQLKPTICFE